MSNETPNEADKLQQQLAEHLIRQRQRGEITRRMYAEAFEQTLLAFSRPTPELVLAELRKQAAEHGMVLDGQVGA